MPEQNGNGKRIILDKKALIPISLVGLLIWGGYWIGMIRADVTDNKSSVDAVEAELKEIPTRYEFIDLKNDIKSIRNSLQVMTSSQKSQLNILREWEVVE